MRLEFFVKFKYQSSTDILCW